MKQLVPVYLWFLLSYTDAVNTSNDDYIVSVTASSDLAYPNEILQFSPSNVSEIFGSASYPNFENTLFSTYDETNGRWFLLQENCLIDVYNPENITLLHSIDYCSAITIQLPAAIHYETETDLLWLFWTDVADVQTQWCSLPASSIDNAEFSAADCYRLNAPEYGTLQYTPDASAFDSMNRVAWAQGQILASSDIILIGFSTISKEYEPIVPMRSLCQHWQVVYLNQSTHVPTLMCTLFQKNALAVIDPASGDTLQTIYKFPELHFPVMHTSIARQRSEETASYYIQLKGATHYLWQEVDCATGGVLSNSSYLIAGNLPLAMPAYISTS